ncbi:MAG: hypothetical protein L6302_10295 [Desulfobacteraceae bacterium]|nr:hypothetical protein [Desulfobacteraceae bacterium]
MYRMRKLFITLPLLLIALVAFASTAFALDPLIEKLKEKGLLDEKEAIEIEKKREEYYKLPNALKDLEFGVKAYVDYSAGSKLSSGNRESYNEFGLTRGYITVKKKIKPWFSVRATVDAKHETAGDTSAKLYESFVTRFKYYYAQFNWPDLGFLTNNKTELGMGHMPWLDFQEHINPYRCQGTMFQERFGGFNSADLGVSLIGYFGGEMDEEYQKKVSKYYPGRYGGYHVGVYNGGGYHSSENNNNKVVEYRLTVRPLPDILPGLQMTYFGLYGKGNSSTYTEDNAPLWRINTGFVSYQHEYFTITGEYCKNTGNQGGSWLQANSYRPLDAGGYSIFGFVRIPGLKALRVHGRYDVFDPDNDTRDDEEKLLIAGLSYDVYKDNMLMLNYERHDYEKNSSSVGVDDSEDKFQLVYQISF